MKDVSISLDQAVNPTTGSDLIKGIAVPLWAIALSVATGDTAADVSRPFTVTNHGESLIFPGPVNLAGTHWERTAELHQLDPYLLYAIALVESSRVAEGRASPWPWALNRGGKSIYASSRNEAIEHLKAVIAHGESNIDVGLMQVNYRWHFGRAGSLSSLIDPVQNVALGAEILSEAIASVPGNLALGVGRYHAWQNKEEALQYGNRVLKLSSRLRHQTHQK